MLWACIVLPHLALDSVLRRHPEPDKPFAIVGGHPQRRELIAVNDAAAQAGLHAGQRMTLAQAILHDFAVVEQDPREAERWQRFLAAWAYRYSSQVYAGWPDAIVLEAQGSFSLVGDWPRFEAQLRADLTALGFRHRIALAPTAHGARVLAGVRDGLAILQREHLRNALGAVQIRRAALPDDAGMRLHHVGLRELRQLFALPRDGLRRRFGQGLLDQVDRMLGDAPELLDCYRPPDTFDVRIELAYEVEQHQALLFPVRRLTADLAAYLAGRDGGVQRFVLRLEHEEHPSTPVEIGLLAAERDPALLFELTRSRLERAEIPAPVVALRLIASHLPPFVPAGRDLFDEQPVGGVPWEQLRERLRARLGPDAVYRIAEATDPRPERAWQRDDGSSADGVEDRPPRPTWLLPQPIPLRGPAPRILSGPERLESGWWDGGDAKRDYYVLELALGQRAWAFAPVGEQGNWMLHGWFA
ncbi:DNA repair nucleotidyltransferase [Pseudoxanthomonas broegbernensis]|uniref:DNA repair nucleotidyltransferase n=1 Tax=Pseudoxanthomonas broegbernensis TaxID=83619 RepID=A0A7V8GPX6_9GAMM|nr:DNA polymerase Y family protein [Pseudoxanthomonas broegbernensis]KAF1687982.1 DNA repair nucleotidyltransferase [Pseudoxanthomonas broegbernensis]MBB6064997.1 protein ImuB [Pseudoxanthomonas broegbernensis]